MNPDVAQVIPEIARSGILEQEKASLLLRIARGELLSVHAEIRLLFYLGVLVASAGAGLLIKQNYDQIGTLAVALAVGLGAAASLGWAIRQAGFPRRRRVRWRADPRASSNYPRFRVPRSGLKL